MCIEDEVLCALVARGKALFIKANVLFCWQKRTRKPPAISTRWTHEKGAARPFQTPKKKSKRKKASRFAKRFFLVSPIYGFAEGVTFLLDVMSSKGVKSAAKQQIGEVQKNAFSEAASIFGLRPHLRNR